MSIQQISVFVENKPGRLAEITSVLAKNKIDLRALSIADTTDYGILRLIVHNPEKAEQVLKSVGMTVSKTDVLAIVVPDKVGGFANAVNVLSDQGVSIEYAYAFITPKRGLAYVIIRVEDNIKAAGILEAAGIHILQQEEIFENV